MVFLYMYIFLVGIVLGSFYNVVGMRVPVGKSVVKPRSACSGCFHTLTARELIPVVSYVLQRGQCRSCGKAISPIYPIFECLNGLLFVYSFYVFGWSMETLLAWTLVSLLLIIVVSDLSYMLIPNKILLFFLPVFLLERAVISLNPWWDSLLGGTIGFLLLLLIAVVSKGGMGGGDVKLFALLGFVVGVKLVLLAFLLSCLTGSVFGMIGLATGHVKRGEPMPFGPFIAIGTLLAHFYGDALIHYYFSLF
jgi:leader peptidase (prepilin peptidase)/N-methyltransferase